MKFKVQMKDPDALIECINDAIEKELEQVDLSSEEIDLIREIRVEKVISICKRWFEYGEYITVEIDTENETCTILNKY